LPGPTPKPFKGDGRPLADTAKLVANETDELDPPWVTILLLGSDEGPRQAGDRTDTMIVAALQRETGRAVLFGIPRNLVSVPVRARFRFPDLLNALYQFGNAHPDLFPGGRDPGATALKQTISRLRSLSGHNTVHPRFAVVKLFKAVSRGETIGVLVDVNARRGRGGVWLDFFGLPVFNTAAIAELAIRTGAAIVFGYSEMLPGPGRRLRIAFTPEIEPANTGDRAKDVLDTSQKCLDRCAEVIRRSPEHWLWTYKRWKRRPTPEVGRYPFYSKYDPNT